MSAASAVETTPPPRSANTTKSEPLSTSPPSPPQTGDRPFNVYVKNFTAEVDDEKLHSMFKEFGTIQSCTVLHDHLGKSKQVGFVQFSSNAEAKTAVEQMHGKTGFGSKPIHVALTNKKPVNRRRSDYYLPYNSYNFSPLRQPMYGPIPLSSPGSPLTPEHGNQSRSPHMYSSGIPAWHGPGGVPMILVPYNTYHYTKQASPYPAANGYQANQKTRVTQPSVPLTPNGLYTGPHTYANYYTQNQYGTPHSPPYNPYYATYVPPAYAGYNAGWGSPYYNYSSHAAVAATGYGFA